MRYSNNLAQRLISNVLQANLIEIRLCLLPPAWSINIVMLILALPKSPQNV